MGGGAVMNGVGEHKPTLEESAEQGKSRMASKPEKRRHKGANLRKDGGAVEMKTGLNGMLLNVDNISEDFYPRVGMTVDHIEGAALAFPSKVAARGSRLPAFDGYGGAGSGDLGVEVQATWCGGVTGGVASGTGVADEPQTPSKGVSGSPGATDSPSEDA